MDKKKGTGGKKDETPDQSRDDLTTESDLDITRSEDPRTEAQLPTKNEIREMLKSLENSAKTEINMLRTDLGNLLVRVETSEDKIDKQAQELCELKEQIKITQQNQIKILYRLEDHTNRNRRQNLRIRAVPETRGEDLRKVITAIFCPLLEVGVEVDGVIYQRSKIFCASSHRTAQLVDL